jgi:hypothetical protein
MITNGLVQDDTAIGQDVHTLRDLVVVHGEDKAFVRTAICRKSGNNTSKLAIDPALTDSSQTTDKASIAVTGPRCGTIFASEVCPSRIEGDLIGWRTCNGKVDASKRNPKKLFYEPKRERLKLTHTYQL